MRGKGRERRRRQIFIYKMLAESQVLNVCIFQIPSAREAGKKSVAFVGQFH